MNTINTSQGNPYPLGTSQNCDGISFSFFSAQADKVFLIIHHNEVNEDAEIELETPLNRTGNLWHIQVSGLNLPLTYSYRITKNDTQYNNVKKWSR